MKKKKRRIIILSLSAILLLVIVGLATFWVIGAANRGQELYDKEYRADYGEWFLLPSAEKTEAYYANGEMAVIESGKIFIDDTKDFSLVFRNGRKTQTSILKVNGNVAPNIYSSRQVVFGTVGESVQFPAVTAHDGVSELVVFQKVLFGEEEQDISDGFVPAQTGEYTWSISATSGTGKIFEKNIPVYIENDATWRDRILSYDKPYGLNQVLGGEGKLSYATEKAFDDEAGSMRVSLSSSFENELTIANAQIEDISGYDAVVFYVYNDSDANVELSICWGGWPYKALKQKQWTEIVYTVEEIETILREQIKYEPVKEFVSTEHINGLTFVYSTSSDDYVLMDDALYFSYAAGIKYLSAAELTKKIDEIVSKGKASARDATLIDLSYRALSPEERAKVTNYPLFSEINANRILAEYGCEKKDDKIIYFDNEVVSEQIQAPSWGSIEYEVTSERTFNGEDVCKFKVLSGGELAFRLRQPFIFDLSEYDYVTFGVYFEYDKPLSYYNWGDTSIGEECSIPLKENQWNTVTIMLGDKTHIQDSMFWIIYTDENGEWKSVDRDIYFYVSPMYAGKGTPDMSNLIIPFDTREGLSYVSEEGENTNVFEYTNNVKYGEEKGSLKVSRNDTSIDAGSEVPGQIYVNLENTHLRVIDTVEVFSLWIYNDSTTRDYSVYLTEKYGYTENRITTLKRGEWTKVPLIITAGKRIQDYSLFFMDGWRYTAGDTLYFSSVRHERSLSGDEIPYDEPLGELFMTNMENVSVAHTTKKAYSRESGSMQATAIKGGPGQMRVDLINADFIGSTEERTNVYKMYVFYDGIRDYSISLMKDGWWGTEKFLANLLPNAWTELEIVVPAGTSLSEYELLLHTSDWRVIAGESVYFSSLQLNCGVTDGLRFDREDGALQLKSATSAYGGRVTADISYTTEMKYGEEAGSVKVAVAEGSKEGRLHLDIENADVPANRDRKYRFYVYCMGGNDYTLSIMDKGYYYKTEGVRLKSGQWTEICITMKAGETLGEHSIVIENGGGTFAATDVVYFSATTEVP